jgi:hypothetical protein
MLHRLAKESDITVLLTVQPGGAPAQVSRRAKFITDVMACSLRAYRAEGVIDDVGMIVCGGAEPRSVMDGLQPPAFKQVS